MLYEMWVERWYTVLFFSTRNWYVRTAGEPIADLCAALVLGVASFLQCLAIGYALDAGGVLDFPDVLAGQTFMAMVFMLVLILAHFWLGQRVRRAVREGDDLARKLAGVSSTIGLVYLGASGIVYFAFLWTAILLRH